MKIIGIDPGTAITGFAIIESKENQIALLEYGCIRTQAGLKNSTRLNQIASDLDLILKKWQPLKAAVEKVFFSKNVKTAGTVMEARGVILQKLSEHAVEETEYTPPEIKSAICGFGKADKKMVQKMVQMTLKLSSIPTPDDAADAIAAALCLAHSLKFR